MPPNQVPEPARENLAILFDADNISRNYVKSILDAAARYGRAIIKRSYGDWTQSNLAGWSDVFREFAIKPIQQFRFTVGKNITDSAMTIDAMDILHSRSVDVFVLVSSDSDFTGLATRIREEGLRVVGVGKKTTARAFVNACDEFLLLENVIGEAEFKEDRGTEPLPKHPKKRTVSENMKSQGRDLLSRAVRTVRDENGLVKGAALGIALRRLDPAFDPKTYGVPKLADFVESFPDVVTLQGSRTSTDPTYKSELRE